MSGESVIVSCEHASNRMPARYRHLFPASARTLRSHRAWDPGAAPLAAAVARSFNAPLFAGEASRLLVDLNRSLNNPAVFSRWTRKLSPSDRRDLVARYYEPYRRAVEQCVRAELRARRRVLHISVHSFTPVWRGVHRRAEVGLLYDPSRPTERALCAAWKKHLRKEAPHLRVRRNYPYRGTSDGFSVALRRQFPASRYACVEVEINQALFEHTATARILRRVLIATLAAARKRPLPL